jgi:hypothetical protein
VLLLLLLSLLLLLRRLFTRNPCLTRSLLT